MMKEIYLTVKELAELKGCTERYIRNCITKGKIIAEEVMGQVGGNSGTHYRIPLSKLEEKIQLKFKGEQNSFKRKKKQKKTLNKQKKSRNTKVLQG